MSCANQAGESGVERSLDLIDFNRRMVELERRLDLFAARVDSLPWWDAVRYHVFEELYGMLAGAPSTQVARRPLLRRALGPLRRTVLRARMRLRLMRRCEILVFRAARQMRTDRRCDPALDDLLSVCRPERYVIETYPDYYHLPLRCRPARDAALQSAIARLLDALRAEFGGGFDADALRKLIALRFAEFRRMLAGYRRLLARGRPRVILMTQNGIEKALFLAASEAGIDVVEVQHGLIGPLHPAYAYPETVKYESHRMFPAVFVTFAPYWERICHYPARERIALGNDHFVIEPLPLPPGPGAVMFISADIYHDVLLEWVIGLASRLSGRRILYKLHPNQLPAVELIRRQFAALPGVEVIEPGVTVRSLLPAVSHVVLIQSTAALETLQSGRRLCILPLLQFRVHEDLFGLESVSVTPTIEDLLLEVEKPPETGAAPRFFDPFDAAGARRLLERYQAAAPAA